jgi:hypothetical protein
MTAPQGGRSGPERDASGLTPREWAIYVRGYESGYAKGAADVTAERDAEWNEIARPIARGGPGHVELEALRYGPGGREHFGDPRPGDFKGRAAEQERRGRARSVSAPRRPSAEQPPFEQQREAG